MIWSSVFMFEGNSQEISLEMLELEKQCHLYTNVFVEHLKDQWAQRCELFRRRIVPLFIAHCFSHSFLAILWGTFG